MKITINRDLLLYNLNNVSHALSSKPTMPIYTGIKMLANEKELILIASNGEISIKVSIIDEQFLTVEETGICVVPGKYLMDVIKSVDAKNVSFTLVDETVLKILAGKSNFSINVLQKEAFPPIAFEETANAFELEAEDLKQLVKKTSFATSQQESRPILTGVSLTVKANKITAIASDAYRVALKSIDYTQNTTEFTSVIPAHSLDEFCKIIDSYNEKVSLYFITRRSVLFKVKNILFITRIIEGTFPAVTNLIPAQYKFSVVFDKSEFTNLLSRVTLFTSTQPNPTIKMSVKSASELEFASSYNEIGTVKETITPISCGYDAPFVISFNSHNVLEAVKSFDGHQISLNINSEMSPFTITSEEDKDLIHILSPLKSN